MGRLAARGSPTFTLHAIAFDSGGRFLWKTAFPTTMRDDNSIFAMRSEELLVRTPEMLTLWSQATGVIARKEISDPRTWIDVSPDREALLLLVPGHKLTLLSTRDLSLLATCAYPDLATGSISNHSIAILLPQQYIEPYNRVRVATICGPAQFEFGWGFPTGRPILLDNTRFIIKGSSTLELVDRDVLRWRLALSKGESFGWEIEPDEKGDVLAVAISKHVGGSVILDINGRFKGMKIGIYRAADGRRTAELVVEHPPRLALYFFALSSDGSVLAVLSDGFLQVAKTRQ